MKDIIAERLKLFDKCDDSLILISETALFEMALIAAYQKKCDEVEKLRHMVDNNLDYQDYSNEQDMT